MLNNKETSYRIICTFYSCKILTFSYYMVLCEKNKIQNKNWGFLPGMVVHSVFSPGIPEAGGSL